MIKHTITASKLLLLLCLCLQLCCQTANGQYLHKLMEDTADVKIDPEVNPVVVGDYVIYQVIENDQKTLWSYHTPTAVKTSLFDGQLHRFNSLAFEPFHDTYLYTIGDLAVFSSTGEFVSNRRIWRTDGTKEGTVPLENIERYVLPKIIPFGDLIISVLDEELDEELDPDLAPPMLFASDGTTSFKHQLDNPNIKNTCAFAADDVITSKYNIAASQTQAIRSSGAQVTVLSDAIDPEFDLVHGALWLVNDTCYVGLYKSTTRVYDVMIVPRSGAVSLLSEAADLADVYRVFPHQNRLYALQSLETDEAVRLKRFKEDFSAFDAEIILPKTNTNRFNILSADDDLIVHDFRNTVGEYTLHYLSSDLVENTDLGGTFYFSQDGWHLVPSVHPTLDGTLYANKLPHSYLLTEVLSYDINRNSDPKIEIPNEVLFHITSHHSNPSAYVMLGNKWTGKTSINAVSQVPAIDKSINGIWHDPNIQNQGMAITTGTRVDGSEYIFVTVYTYANGNPLWLAGVGELSLPQTVSIELPLAHYRGINTFEAGVDPEQEIFGSVNITMTGCDSMKATFTSNNDVYALDLTRIHNTEFSHLCND